MVLRDRNHPSVVIWGIGNEIPEVFVESGGPIAKKLAEQVRSLDGTRPLTQAMPGTTSGPTQKAVFSVRAFTHEDAMLLLARKAFAEEIPLPDQLDGIVGLYIQQFADALMNPFPAWDRV